MKGLGVIVVVVLLLVGLIGGMSAIVNFLEFPARVAAIEQLRTDAALVCVTQSEDVVGQVTATNQEIRKWQAYNGNPLLDPFIPDGWDGVETIAITDSPNCFGIP